MSQDLINQLISESASDVDTQAIYNEAPAEYTKEQIEKIKQSMDETEIQSKRDNTNNTEVIALLSNRPHTNVYVRDVMGIPETVCINEQVKDRPSPLYIPDKPRAGIDGYQIKTPDGALLNLTKPKLQSWLMENTFGMIAGGSGEKGITLKARRARDAAGLNNKPTFVLKVVGLDASNAADVIPTYEQATGPNGEKLTREVTVTLSETFMKEKRARAGETAKETKTRAKGVIQGYPVWRRKRDFEDDLGPISMKGLSEVRKINSQAELDAALDEFIKTGLQAKVFTL